MRYETFMVIPFRSTTRPRGSVGRAGLRVNAGAACDYAPRFALNVDTAVRHLYRVPSLTIDTFEKPPLPETRSASSNFPDTVNLSDPPPASGMLERLPENVRSGRIAIAPPWMYSNLNVATSGSKQRGLTSKRALVTQASL